MSKIEPNEEDQYEEDQRHDFNFFKDGELFNQFEFIVISITLLVAVVFIMVSSFFVLFDIWN